jgi:acyl-CoA reductase-like NAD-dependent aldehyde dehydrogenase
MGRNALEKVYRTAATHGELLTKVAECKGLTNTATNNERSIGVQLQLETARAAQAVWSGTSLRNRLMILRKLRLKIAGDPRALAIKVDRENLAETLAAEVLPLLDACRFLECKAPQILREQVISNRGRPTWQWGNQIALRPEPLGVVLIISPSNYSLMLPGIQALQAIAAGNAVVIKPAIGSSKPIQALVSLAISAGLPAGLIQWLPESVEAVAAAIRQGVDKVFLTGSATTGKVVGRALAESTTPSVMELSGCDAVFVLEDADLNLVSDCLLFGLTLNNSQTCMAPRRVFASDQQTDEILKLLKTKFQTWKRDRGTIPLTESIGSVETTIRAAIAHGAELVLGSLTESNTESLSGVSVLDRVTSDMCVAQTDLFAPVLSFIRVKSESHALEENAKCPFALSATVFGSAARCQRFARRIPVGCVVINDMIVPTADPRVPFGGRSGSGHGMTRGQAGLLEMTQLKAIVRTRKWFKPHLHRATVADADVLEQLIRLEHAANPLKSLKALPNMIKATVEQIRLRRALRRSDRAVPNQPSTNLPDLSQPEIRDPNSFAKKQC